MVNIAPIVSSIFSNKSANKAGDAQTQASGEAIEEQRRQFDKVQSLLAPFVSAGSGAIGQLNPYMQGGQQAFDQQKAFLGLSGANAQRGAIENISNSPMFAGLVQQGENAILQNASATGGLRGGNTQAALAQFRPEMLRQLIESQYAKLGGLSSAGLNTTQNLVGVGQASAAGTGAAAQNAANNIGGYLNNMGNARAQQYMTQGQNTMNAFNGLQQGAGQAAGLFLGGGLF